MRKAIDEDRFAPLLLAVRDAVRGGTIEDARRQALSLLEWKIPRRNLSEVANLLRLSLLPSVGARILHRLVRPANRAHATASEVEKATYAICLNDLGAVNEAQKILERLDGGKTPVALLFGAFCHFRVWNWEEATPLLERFVGTSGMTEYQSAAGPIWLAAALQHGRGDFERARALLEKSVEPARSRGWRILYRNSLLYLAQNHFYTRDWKLARARLDELEADCGGRRKDPYYFAAATQWRACVDLAHGGDRASALRRLHRARAQFFEHSGWDDARRCDFYEAVILKEPSLVLHVFAGTPFPAARRKLQPALLACGLGAEPPADYLWRLPGAEGEPPIEIDVSNGRHALAPRSFLKEGQVRQRLLEALARDFYRPMQVAELHERLHPRDFYNPDSSPDRVHQALKRLREWIGENRLPLAVREQDGFYRLEGTSPLALRIPLRPPPARHAVPAALANLVTTARGRFGGADFSAIQFAAAVKLSHPSAIRYLRQACERGAMARIGRGPATRYRLR